MPVLAFMSGGTFYIADTELALLCTLTPPVLTNVLGATFFWLSKEGNETSQQASEQSEVPRHTLPASVALDHATLGMYHGKFLTGPSLGWCPEGATYLENQC